MQTQTVTLQARLPRGVDAAVVAALDAYAALFSRLERAYLAAVTRGDRPVKPRFMQDHGISGRQFNAQHHLDSNGFASHDQWKQAWQRARTNHLFVLGSKDESVGCQGCTLGQTISYRFVRDERRGWRVLLSTDLRAPKATFDPQTGVVAVDFNASHLSIAELDARGNKVVAWDIQLSNLQATSKQNRTQLEVAALEMVANARATGKPVVIENLDFARKKAGMLKGERGAQAYQRMLSRLSWQAFARALSMQCRRNEVALKAVNPAFTSLIGALKFSTQTAFNGHQAAAMVIGRRGMGKIDTQVSTIPRQCIVRPGGCARPFTPPEDGVEDEPHALKKTAGVYRQWCAADREARSLRRRTRRQQQASAQARDHNDPRACAEAAS